MPFTIEPPKVETPQQAAIAIIADRRIYLADDQKTLAEEGSVEAATLLVPKGGRIDGADVERLHLSLVDGSVVQNAEPAPTEPTPDTPEPTPEPEKVEPSPEPEKVEVPAEPTDAKPAASSKREKK